MLVDTQENVVVTFTNQLFIYFYHGEKPKNSHVIQINTYFAILLTVRGLFNKKKKKIKFFYILKSRYNCRFFFLDLRLLLKY